jgi:alpha-1,2-glucosyltransferase
VSGLCGVLALVALWRSRLVLGGPLRAVGAGLAMAWRVGGALGAAVDRGAAALLATTAAPLALAMAALLAGCVTFTGRPIYGDETTTVAQIGRFARGDLSVEPIMSTLPGFHALVTLVLLPFGVVTLGAMRLVAAGLSALTILACYGLARQVDRATAGVRLLQCVFLPILFPQFFLAYTDVTGLLFVVLMVWAALGRRYGVAGLCGLLAWLVRQQAIVWVVYVLVSAVVRDWTPPGPTVLALARRYWSFVFTGLLFLAFVVLNGGVAVGDGNRHPVGLYLPNVFFGLFVAGVCFVPLWGARLREAARLLRQPWVWAGLIGLAVAFAVGFRIDHPYNYIHGFLRNEILMWVNPSSLHRLVFFVPVALAALGLFATPLCQPRWLLYGASLLVLLPEWLVEQRYYLVAMTLFLLLRAPGSPRVERVQMAYGLGLSGILFYLVTHGFGDVRLL